MGSVSATLRLSGDLSLFEQGLLGVLVLCTWALLAFEFSRRKTWSWAIATSGIVGSLGLALAVARPVQVQESGLSTGARVIVLVDQSERMTLPSDDARTRRERAQEAATVIAQHLEGARVEVLAFGTGPLAPPESALPARDSDLLAALEKVGQLPGDRPASVVVVSDGRLTTPGAAQEAGQDAFVEAVTHARQGLPVHTVSVVRRMPRDIAIRAVQSSGTAVAHQAFPLTIEVGCQPENDCPDVRVVVRELLENAAPQAVGQGQVKFTAGRGVLELPATLERAGGRVLEIALEGQPEDEVPQNDRRFVSFEVRRDRMRILHVSGRPTYDVRALRMFLKSDESIDLVSFFILRTLADRVGATESELALIPFPVEELFTEHLPSFDAIILQDIDAREYQLDRHFEAMRDYVQKGGGLILVGGPGAFAAGGYADSPLEDVLPVSIPRSDETIDQKPAEPRYTAAGLGAPMLSGLRDLLSTRLPTMAGSNRLGAARPGALVLWDHPTLTVAGKGPAVEPMPLLALGEVGDGRSIALGVDGTHKLRFGELGAEAAGRGHTALWEGLLGWLMRDPRYEAARIEGPALCFAGKPFDLRVTPLPGMGQEVELSLTPLGRESGAATQVVRQKKSASAAGETVVFHFEGAAAGAYVARSKVGQAPPTRLVFACEQGAGALSDSRPDAARLARVAEAAEGRAVELSSIDLLPLPKPTRVLTHSSVRPWVPDWVWATLAAVVLGLHWWLRRVGGLP